MNICKLWMSSLVIMLCSCSGHDMYYDINNQKLISCDKKRFRMLEISGESDGVLLFWSDTARQAPKILSLNHISKEYEIRTGGLKRNKPFFLIPNESYLITKSGSGEPDYSIRIWTNSKGTVFKTTHPKCGLESLQE